MQEDAAEAEGAGDDLVPEASQVVQYSKLDARSLVQAEEVADRLGRTQRLDGFCGDQDVWCRRAGGWKDLAGKR